MKVTADSAIERLKAIESGINESFIVELSKPSKLKNKYMFFTISDEPDKFKGMIEVRDPSQNVRAIMEKRRISALKVRITQHITHFEDDQPQCIEIVDFDLNEEPCKTERKANKRVLKVVQEINLYEDEQFSFFHNATVKSIETIIKENLQQNEKNAMAQPKVEQFKASQDSVQTCPQRATNQESQYQKIKDLYLQFYNWALVVKVTNANYREFCSKMGRETKVLTLDLIDEDGCTISGSFFGQLAFEKHKQFKIGQTYQISKGKVKQETYNKYKKSSKFSLLFNKDTVIQPAVNNPIFSVQVNDWVRLSELSKVVDSQQPSNFVGIVIEVQSPRELSKGDRSLVIQNLKIADPITSMTSEIVIWNNQIEVKEDFLNRSVLLKMFKPKRYQDRYQLNSTCRSSIILHDFFASHEGKYNLGSKAKTAETKTIHRLAGEIQGQDQRKTTQSTLNVWVKQMGFDKKWFYDACPNPRCKKTCGNNNTNRCQHCLFEFLECDKRFMLEVKLVDLTGSIQVTAFDESANVFLKNMPMEALFPMTNKELCLFSESMFCYQQYRVQIISKADPTGKIKHTIKGKPIKINVNEAINQNLAMIRSLAMQLNCLEDN